METRTYEVTLHGKTPFLMHSLSVDWNDYMREFLLVPGNKKKGAAGDDRYPAWKWVGYCYNDDGYFMVPSDNLMTMLREGGKKVPTGKGKETFKVMSQTGLFVNEAGWRIEINNKPVSFAPFEALIDNEPDFKKHEALAKEYGFMLWSKHVTINGKKNVRVRPRFDLWSCSGSITILEDMITERVFQDILDIGGMRVGLGDWRPSAPHAPGRFGMFSASIKLISGKRI